ncbi:leucine-rich repeat extensin-like protein 3 isoform X1 [Perca fluviatilis]|uniref:leucine-rich repeat extensin-like protein 3 isoform X1 n=1 Tax=Perca fluviatilis TaxID=8168 RepID=UPI001962742A|nr:leucine-rich repeat extensin-like protein 3 isoform X1 [Perca fluviatilis]XP_039679042.1 leucine-rich repeat extensin-like protein 3 isoform X1 [Perca fluviatilis]XP_039679043.1 leucine-rich repeat extensin-like protein 3 isoform X1 [Perca fluviatilis]XP_039679044.1 leucine-rich repeat extensin-like protein 3 isoform X1 [Perca fluviatilis]
MFVTSTNVLFSLDPSDPPHQLHLHLPVREIPFSQTVLIQFIFSPGGWGVIYCFERCPLTVSSPSSPAWQSRKEPPGPFLLDPPPLDHSCWTPLHWTIPAGPPSTGPFLLDPPSTGPFLLDPLHWTIPAGPPSTGPFLLDPPPLDHSCWTPPPLDHSCWTHLHWTIPAGPPSTGPFLLDSPPLDRFHLYIKPIDWGYISNLAWEGLGIPRILELFLSTIHCSSPSPNQRSENMNLNSARLVLHHSPPDIFRTLKSKTQGPAFQSTTLPSFLAEPPRLPPCVPPPPQSPSALMSYPEHLHSSKIHVGRLVDGSNNSGPSPRRPGSTVYSVDIHADSSKCFQITRHVDVYTMSC